MKSVTVVKSLLAGVIAMASLNATAAGINAYHFHCNSGVEMLVAQPSPSSLIVTLDNKAAFKKVSDSPVNLKGVPHTMEYFEGIDNPFQLMVVSQDKSGAPKIYIRITEPNGNTADDICYRFDTVKIKY